MYEALFYITATAFIIFLLGTLVVLGRRSNGR